MRSKPPREEYGPVWPKPEIEQQTSLGLSADRASWSIPSRAAVPGLKLSITTSATAAIALNVARSSADFRSSVTERLFRFHSMNGALSPPVNGGVRRMSSPPLGFSILTTSAPWSARIIAQYGPER